MLSEAHKNKARQERSLAVEFLFVVEPTRTAALVGLLPRGGVDTARGNPASCCWPTACVFVPVLVGDCAPPGGGCCGAGGIAVGDNNGCAAVPPAAGGGCC